MGFAAVSGIRAQHHGLSFSFGQVKIISGSLDGTVRIWCLETGECVREMQAHQGGVMSLQVCGCGALVFSGGDFGL